MLGLKMTTDPKWANIAENNIEEILSDHAFCEQKAASNAIWLIVNYPEYSDLVTQMLAIAQEELQHFGQVHDIILHKGLVLGRERKDNYVNELVQFMRRGYQRNVVLVDRLLFSAIIEARSCERFKVLHKNIKDQQLSKFYYDLMVSEANHYTVFIALARKYANGINVDERWQQWLEFEATVIEKYGQSEAIHG
jgi:tRNA 2-(methylsulfanyl)-N6-isopentenyladenosine37 hydroxylase